MNAAEEAERRYPSTGDSARSDAVRGGMRDLFIAGAEWARKQTLEECADLAMSNWVGSTNTQGMSYEDAAAWEQAEEIASAIRALGTPGEES